MKSEQLYTDVMDKLTFEPSVDASDITLRVDGAVVTLGGEVGSLFEKHAAERAVQSVSGVKGIANELRIKLTPEWQRSDTDIATAALNALKWNSAVPRDRIQVSVESGCVTLSGTVDWWYQCEPASKALKTTSLYKAISCRATCSRKSIGNFIGMHNWMPTGFRWTHQAAASLSKAKYALGLSWKKRAAALGQYRA